MEGLVPVESTTQGGVMGLPGGMASSESFWEAFGSERGKGGRETPGNSESTKTGMRFKEN